jgi:uncharacterized protein (DUF433 family)
MSADIPTTVDLRKYIDTSFYDERPHIRGRRLPVSFIVANARENNWNIGELAHQFTLSEEEVLAALLYYRENKDEIDRQDDDENRLWEEMHRQSRL